MTDLERAVQYLREDGYSVVAVKEGRLLGGETGAGVKPFVQLAEKLGGSLEGAALADRVIGRAVALVCADLGLAAVHADLISDGALAVLEAAGIPVQYGIKAPFILNRSRTGRCPTEELVQGVTDPREALRLLQEFVARGPGIRPPAG